MGTYLSAVWRCRYFWLSLVKMDLETRYRRSVLGLGWSLLNPLAMTLILYTVFHPIFQADIPNYALYVLAGLVLWNYFTSTTLQGCHCLLQAEAYIRQHPSPLAIFPLRTALGGMIHCLIALVVVGAVGVHVHGWPSPLVLLSLVPGLLLLFALTWSTALLAGFANVLFRDTEHLLQVAFQVLFYGTPIIYSAQTLRDFQFGWLLRYNPLSAFLDLLRDPIYNSQVPHWSAFAVASGTVLVTSVAAAVVLHRLQKRLIFYL